MFDCPPRLIAPQVRAARAKPLPRAHAVLARGFLRPEQFWSGAVDPPAAGSRRFPSRPNGVNAGDLFRFDRVNELSRPDTEDVMTIIDKMAGAFDGFLGARKHHEVLRSAPPILDVPFHLQKE